MERPAPVRICDAPIHVIPGGSVAVAKEPLIREVLGVHRWWRGVMPGSAGPAGAGV